MTAYAVGLYNMHRRDWIDAYRNPVTGLIAKHAGKYLSRASTCRWEMLEGDRPMITGITLIEFPSMELARSWHRNVEYQPYIKIRQAGSHLDLMLVEDPAIE
jgi:uncharacterized protein (DUF1330 family)